jgi:hypothetical protein
MTLITLADILLLMLGYTGLSLSGVCLIWHFGSTGPAAYLQRTPV